MRLAYFTSLFVTVPLLLTQSNPVHNTHRSAEIASPVRATQTDAAAQGRILDSYGKLPLSFEANHGQVDGTVKFISRTGGYTLFLTQDEAVLALRGHTANADKTKLPAIERVRQSGKPAATAADVLRMKLHDANPAARITGVDELAGTSNYFIGNDPKKWRTNVSTYAKVKYEGIYSGIDLVYYGNQRQLEYDFIVAPGADPSRIVFDVRGAQRIRRDEHGDLVLKMSEGEIRWHKPVVYQEKDGTRQEIAARYATPDTNRVTFEVAKYDASRPLYIDPLIYSTYLGGSGSDTAVAIAVDSQGAAYVTGTTYSTDFPGANPLKTTYAGNGDAFVAKINPAGSALVYSTYLGGGNIDQGEAIAVDGNGDAYVTGFTNSANFPTSNALQTSFGGEWDAFVTELNPSGTALIYSTYLGGSNSDWGFGIRADGSGNAYVTGLTGSTDFPTKNPLQASNAGSSVNAFVTKISTNGAVWFTPPTWGVASPMLVMRSPWIVPTMPTSPGPHSQPTFH